MHSVVKHIPFPAVGREGKGSTSFDGHRTALNFISALNVQRSIYPVKTRGLICVCLQSPAPTPLGAGRAHPQGLLPALCPSLGMFGELALPAGLPRSCCEEQPALLPRATTASSEVPPPRRTAQGARLQPNCSTALSGKQPGSFLIKQPGEFLQAGSAPGCATSSTAAAEAGMP